MLLFIQQNLQGTTGITGTLAATETGSDTLAASGKILVKGALAATETGLDTLAASGKVLVSGSLAATETGSDVFAATGTSAPVTTGTMAVTEVGDDVMYAEGTVSGGVTFIPTKGGIPKAKTYIKKSEREDIEAIVKREFDILDGTYVEEIVEEIREEVIPQIQQIDFTQYDLAIQQVNDLLLQAKLKAAEYEIKLKEAEEDDEEAILMLL